MLTEILPSELPSSVLVLMCALHLFFNPLSFRFSNVSWASFTCSEPRTHQAGLHRNLSGNYPTVSNCLLGSPGSRFWAGVSSADYLLERTAGDPLMGGGRGMERTRDWREESSLPCSPAHHPSQPSTTLTHEEPHSYDSPSEPLLLSGRPTLLHTHSCQSSWTICGRAMTLWWFLITEAIPEGLRKESTIVFQATGETVLFGRELCIPYLHVQYICPTVYI